MLSKLKIQKGCETHKWGEMLKASDLLGFSEAELNSRYQHVKSPNELALEWVLCQG